MIPKTFQPLSIMRRYGLIGHPLSHSFSREYFTDKFELERLTDCVYENYDLPEISGLRQLLETYPGLCGFNVTIPHKKSIIPFLDDLADDAREIGAVNTVCVTSQGLVGYNTDWFAFMQSLRPLLREDIATALILGTGGAARAVGYALQQLEIPHRYVSRQPAEGFVTYASLTDAQVAGSHLIVNATPAGMAPHTDTRPMINYDVLTSQHLLYDLVYNPPHTRFLEAGKQRNARIKNGMEMLYLQADAAWELWQSSNR